MSYSRRELYAMGEPFGDCATERKVDGRYLCGLGGGGGGNPANTTQTVTQELPAWARPFAKEALGKAAALSNSPYQTYGGERVAQFTPLQKQAFEQAGGQQVASQIGQATGLAGLVGGSSFRDQGTAQGFMSPYMQAVVDQQMSSAQRQADIAGERRKADFIRAGGFGGARQAIENAEAAKALASQKAELQAKGLQTAFEQAQNQFNQEQTQRLNAAQALGTLGTSQFGQEMDIMARRADLGGQQRAATQDILSQQYQDFLNQQRSPYDQLAFLTSMIRGTPMGGTTAQYQTSAAPSTASQLIGLGTAAAGAYGASKGSAAGGEVKGYAAGGGIGALLDDVGSLSDEQLGQMQEGEKPPLTAAIVAEEILRRQALREDMAQQQAMMAPPPNTTVVEDEFEQLAGLPGLPARNLDGMDTATMAGGGIVAFQEGGGTSQFMQDVYSIPRRFNEMKARAREEDERKAAEAKQAQERRAAIDAARQKASFSNYLFGSPEREAEGKAELKALLETPATRTPVPVATPAAAAASSDMARELAKLQDKGPALSGISAALPPAAAAVAQGKPGTEQAAPTGAGAGVAPAGLSALKAQTASGMGDLKAQLEAVNKARTDAANAAVERAKAQEAELGEYGAEESKRLKEREKELEGAKEQNVNMALVNAGLAIMAGTSANWFENVGKGALVGTKAYTEGIQRIQNTRDKVDDAVIALEKAKRSDKRVSQERMDRLEANVANAATANAEALYNFGSKALDMSREDARFATEVALKQAQIAASNKQSFEERMVMALGKGDMAAGYKALKAMDAKPADLMGEFNDFLKANPMLATGPQEQAIAAYMRSKLALSGLGAVPRASSAASGPVRD